MDKSPQNEIMKRIERLHKGGIVSNPVIKSYVDKAITTGDCVPLYEHLDAFQVFEVMAERNIRLSEYHQLDNPFPYPDRNDAREYLSGPYELGYVNLFDDMFGIHPDDLCLPFIVPGRPGGGKSYLILYLLNQILRELRKFNVIIPDLKGKEYRSLLTDSKNLKIITKDKIKLNPLQAPDWMTPMEYIMFFSKVFTRENYLVSTSESILIKYLDYIYRKRGIFDGSKNWPTFRDLYNVVTYYLENEKKSFRYRDVLLGLQNRLDPFIYSEHFNCQIGIPHDVWRTENVVLEMGKGFTDNMYSFLVSFIAGLRYHYNMEMGLIGSKLRSLLIIDEGRLLLKSRDTETFGESYFTEIITKFREPGIGIIVSSQETDSFNQTIRGISYTKICFPLTDGKDKGVIRESFGLNDDQAEYVYKLPRSGQAIVRYGGYENPFLLAVPPFNLQKIVTDEEVERRMTSFYKEIEDKMKQTQTNKPLHVSETMPPAAVSLLYFLSQNPFTKANELNKAPGFTSSTLNWLEKNGFIQKEYYRTSKIGRKSKFSVLTQKAYTYLGVKGVAGKGNFEHKHNQHMVSQWLSKDGWNVKIEGKIKEANKLIDVLAQSEDGIYVAYEITLHFENLLSNIRQDFDSGASEVHIVTRDKADMKKAIKIVNNDSTLHQYRDRIAFSQILDFFS